MSFIMFSLLRILTRYLLMALLLLNMLLPMQAVFACLPMASESMDIACGTAPAALDVQGVSQLQQSILLGNSCCYEASDSGQSIVSASPTPCCSAVEPGMEPVAHALAETFPTIPRSSFTTSLFLWPGVADTPGFWGTDTYARTRRFRI